MNSESVPSHSLIEINLARPVHDRLSEAAGLVACHSVSQYLNRAVMYTMQTHTYQAEGRLSLHEPGGEAVGLEHMWRHTADMPPIADGAEATDAERVVLYVKLPHNMGEAMDLEALTHNHGDRLRLIRNAAAWSLGVISMQEAGYEFRVTDPGTGEQTPFRFE
jgi:hypothetical protein